MLLIQHLKSLGLQTYDIRPCLHLIFCTHTNDKLFQNDSHSYIYGLIYSHSLPPSFSLPSPVADMAKLAQETLGCQAELLCGGLGGPNRDRVLQHLITGHPLLIPYDEDFNHEPCQKKGHKAHWAVSAGVLIGVQNVPSPGYIEDSELPGLFHPVPGAPHQPPSFPEESSPSAIFLLSKQGKSWHYQLWDYSQVRDSNLQLTDFSPARAADGRVYVVPAGGVQAGLCGQALLLRPQEGSH